MLLLLGPHHSVVVGAHCCSVVGLGCSVLPWVIAGVARFGVVGAHVVVHIRIHGLLLVIVGMDIREQLVIMCTFVFEGSGWLLWAVDGHFAWRVICGALSVFVGICRHSCLWVVIGHYWR